MVVLRTLKSLYRIRSPNDLLNPQLLSPCCPNVDQVEWQHLQVPLRCWNSRELQLFNTFHTCLIVLLLTFGIRTNPYKFFFQCFSKDSSCFCSSALNGRSFALSQEELRLPCIRNTHVHGQAQESIEPRYLGSNGHA